MSLTPPPGGLCLFHTIFETTTVIAIEVVPARVLRQALKVPEAIVHSSPIWRIDTNVRWGVKSGEEFCRYEYVSFAHEVCLTPIRPGGEQEDVNHEEELSV